MPVNNCQLSSSSRPTTFPGYFSSKSARQQLPSVFFFTTHDISRLLLFVKCLSTTTECLFFLNRIGRTHQLPGPLCWTFILVYRSYPSTSLSPTRSSSSDKGEWLVRESSSPGSITHPLSSSSSCDSWLGLLPAPTVYLVGSTSTIALVQYFLFWSF